MTEGETPNDSSSSRGGEEVSEAEARKERQVGLRVERVDSREMREQELAARSCWRVRRGEVQRAMKLYDWESG